MQPPHSVMSPHSTIPILNFVRGGCAPFCVSGFVSVSLAEPLPVVVNEKMGKEVRMCSFVYFLNLLWQFFL